nr:unnamed protein product [Callosobruchus analis]
MRSYNNPGKLRCAQRCGASKLLLFCLLFHHSFFILAPLKIRSKY